jgi:hypothetical protein
MPAEVDLGILGRAVALHRMNGMPTTPWISFDRLGET